MTASEAVGECDRLRRELSDARAQIAKLTAIARDQAKALAELTDECPPWAPSIAVLYWLYGPTRWHEANWPKVFNRLSPLIDNGLGRLPAARLTPEVWARHLATRKAQIIPTTGAPPKDSVLNIELGRAKELLDWAVANKHLKYNPLKPARAIPTVGHRETWLPMPEIDKLLAAADDVVDQRLGPGDDDGYRAIALRAFILTCHDSMLRFNEALGLRRDRIGADGRVELASRETKSKRRRVVYLTPRTLEAVALVPGDPALPWVFARDGAKLHERRMRYWFRKACEIAGVDLSAAPGERQIRPHDLRASGASTADEHGARTTALRDALGHRSLQTTEHYLRSAQAENARSVAGVIVEATNGRRGPLRAAAKKSASHKHFLLDHNEGFSVKR